MTTINFYNIDGNSEISLSNFIGTQDILVAKLTQDGYWVWAAKAEGTATVFVDAIAVDKNNNVYACGAIFASTNFYNIDGSSTISLANPTGKADGYVAKINSKGIWKWALKAESAAFESTDAVTVYDNYVYAIGNYKEPLSLYNANGNLATTLSGNTVESTFVGKITTSGNWLWATNITGVSNSCYDLVGRLAPCSKILSVILHVLRNIFLLLGLLVLVL